MKQTKINLTARFDWLDLLVYLNPKSFSFEMNIQSTKPIMIDGNSIASALAGLEDWEQAWAYILANHSARQSEMYMCHAVLKHILNEEMLNNKSMKASHRIIYANNIAWGAIHIATHHRTNPSRIQKAQACSIDKETFRRTYQCYFERVEQEIAMWENNIRDCLRDNFRRSMTNQN